MTVYFLSEQAACFLSILDWFMHMLFMEKTTYALNGFAITIIKTYPRRGAKGIIIYYFTVQYYDKQPYSVPTVICTV